MLQFLHQITNCTDFCLFELSLSMYDLQNYGNLRAVEDFIGYDKTRNIPSYLVIDLSLYIGLRFAGLLLRFLRIFHFTENVCHQLAVDFETTHNFLLCLFYKFRAGPLSSNRSVSCVFNSTHVSSLYDWHTHSVCYCSIEMSFSHHAMQNVWLWSDFENLFEILWKWMKNDLNLNWTEKRE